MLSIKCRVCQSQFWFKLTVLPWASLSSISLTIKLQTARISCCVQKASSVLSVYTLFCWGKKKKELNYICEGLKKKEALQVFYWFVLTSYELFCLLRCCSDSLSHLPVWCPFARTVLLTQNHFSLHNHIFMPHGIPTCGFLVINDVTMQILLKLHMYFVHLFPYGKHFNFPWPLCSSCMSFWLFLLLKSSQSVVQDKIQSSCKHVKLFWPRVS